MVAGFEERVSASPMVDQALKLIDPGGIIGKLQPRPRVLFEALVLCLAHHGYGRVRVVAGNRSMEEEELIYGSGRTAVQCEAAGVPGKYARPEESVRSWCQPKQSKHVLGLAIDLDVSYYVLADDPVVEGIVKAFPMSWGGMWSVRDYGHFQIVKGEENG